MKETFYFSHDYNARTDSKIKDLIRKHGFEGYGIYWGLIEDLYNNANALRLDCEGIAFDFHCKVELIKSVLNDFGLFVFDGDYFGSLSVQRRIDERDSKSKKARDSAFKRWNKDATALPTHSDRNAIKESIVKEIKVKEKRVARQPCEPPSEYEVKEYANQNGYKSVIMWEKMQGYIQNGMRDSQGNPILNWKLKLNQVWFKPEYKQKERGLNY